MPRITDILVHPVEVPRTPFQKARGLVKFLRAAIVEVRTDEGIVGLGEADPTVPRPEVLLEEVVLAIRHYLRPALLGKDPRNFEQLRLEMDRVLAGNLLAKDTVEVALVDAAARLQGVPATFILGGQLVDRVPVIAPLPMRPPEETAAAAADYVARGFVGIKLKIGLEPRLDVERIRAVREAVGPDIILRADANGHYSFADALRTIRQLDRYGMQCIEQPLPGWDLDGMSRLAALVETPLMVDESLKEAPSAIDIIRRRAAGMFHVKVRNHGGMLRARQVIAMAEAAGIPCIVGQISEMSIGAMCEAVVAASATNVLLPGEMAGPLVISGDVVKRPLDLSRGVIEMPAGPGFGLELDPAALERFRVKLLTG